MKTKLTMTHDGTLRFEGRDHAIKTIHYYCAANYGIRRIQQGQIDAENSWLEIELNLDASILFQNLANFFD